MRLWNVTQLWKRCHFINLSKMYIIIYLSKHCLFENYSILLDLPTQTYESLNYSAIGKFHNCQPNQPTLPWVKQSESRVKTRPEQRQAKEDVLKNLCTVAGSFQKIFFKIWMTQHPFQYKHMENLILSRNNDFLWWTFGPLLHQNYSGRILSKNIFQNLNDKASISVWTYRIWFYQWMMIKKLIILDLHCTKITFICFQSLKFPALLAALADGRLSIKTIAVNFKLKWL